MKEPWRKQAKPKPKKDPKKRKEKLKNKGVGTFELEKPLEKDHMDMQWNFGVFEFLKNLVIIIFFKKDSPERGKTKRVDWSSEDEEKERNKRIGEIQVFIKPNEPINCPT